MYFFLPYPLSLEPPIFSPQTKSSISSLRSRCASQVEEYDVYSSKSAKSIQRHNYHTDVESSNSPCSKRFAVPPSSQFEITSSPFRWVQSKLQFKTWCAPSSKDRRDPSLPLFLSLSLSLALVVLDPPKPTLSRAILTDRDLRIYIRVARSRSKLEKCLNRSELIISLRKNSRECFL